MWKCKECKTEIIEDYRQMTDEQGNFAGDMFVGFVCPKCLNFGIVEEHIADWEEEDSFERYSFDENNILYKKGLKIMQYTGLKDKNNKEIYEGDIVKLRANHGIGIVKYYDEWGAFVIEYIKPRPLVVLGMSYYKEDIEVIGNIYENPELIKEVR